MHRLDRGGFALRLGPHADAELLLLRPGSGPRPSGRRRRAAAGRARPAGCAGSSGVAEVLVQRHVAAHEVQHQFVALEAGRQAAFAGHAGLVVAPFEVPEGPVAVEHLQRAADVAKRIGKLVEADRATVRRQQEMLVHRLVGPVAPHPHVEARPCRGDRASGPPPAVSRAGRPAAPRRSGCRRPWPRTSRSGRRNGCVDLGRQSHRLAPAVRREVDLQQIVLQIERSLAVIQPVGKLVVRERDVQTAHRHLRPPRLAVVGEPHVGVDLAGGQILVPLLLRGLRQDVQQRAVQIQLADFRRQRQAGWRARSPIRRHDIRSVAWPLRAVRSSIA